MRRRGFNIKQIEGYKICSKCKHNLPIEKFSKHIREKDGLRCNCKDCDKLYKKKYLSKEENRLKTLVYSRKTSNDRANWWYKSKFNITLDDYDRMFEEQKGVCAICGQPQKSSRRLAVDHNHITGKIRGLLCTVCNTDLGWYERQKENIEKYLGENK